MWKSFEAALRAYALSENREVWINPIVKLFKQNHIRPGTWVIIDDHKYTYEKELKSDKYIIHMKDHTYE